MTVTAAPPLADARPSGDAPGRDLRQAVTTGLVALALVWWAFVLTHATGGRDHWALTRACVPALVAFLAVRPWRTLATSSLVLGAAVGTAPVLVCIIDPPHWFGADQAATYAYAAVLFLTVRAWATTPGRRIGVVALVLAAAVAQFAWAMIPWVGSDDPTGQLLGTFYWYNQFAAFMLAPAVIAVGVAAIARGPMRLAAVVVAVLGSAGVVLSTSRATMALLAGGWLAAGVVAVVVAPGTRSRAMAALRWTGLAILAVGFTKVLPGPPLFTHRVSALASTAARNAQMSIGQNGGFRVQFWRQSLIIFRHHPLTGAGFGTFGQQAIHYVPSGGHANLVHNGFLQPLSDGGLLLGLPFLLACAAIGVGLLRRLRPSAWRVEDGLPALTALACLAAFVHSGVDFDWTYPSLMAFAAVLAATALAVPATGDLPTGHRRTVGLVSAGVLVAVTVVLAQQAIKGGWQLSAPRHVPVASNASASTGHGVPAS